MLSALEEPDPGDLYRLFLLCTGLLVIKDNASVLIISQIFQNLQFACWLTDGATRDIPKQTLQCILLLSAGYHRRESDFDATERRLTVVLFRTVLLSRMIEWVIDSYHGGSDSLQEWPSGETGLKPDPMVPGQGEIGFDPSLVPVCYFVVRVRCLLAQGLSRGGQARKFGIPVRTI